MHSRREIPQSFQLGFAVFLPDLRGCPGAPVIAFTRGHAARARGERGRGREREREREGEAACLFPFKFVPTPSPYHSRTTQVVKGRRIWRKMESIALIEFENKGGASSLCRTNKDFPQGNSRDDTFDLAMMSRSIFLMALKRRRAARSLARSTLSLSFVGVQKEHATHRASRILREERSTHARGRVGRPVLY